MDVLTILEPTLLIQNHKELKLKSNQEIIDFILNKEYSLIDKQSPASRFRGTLINFPDNKNDKINIIGWQKNIGRFLKMDSSTFTFIFITINKDSIIESISLSPSFKGSKGIICSQKYLNKNLQKLIGLKIDSSSFFMNIKVNKLHCFHLTEILGGIHSFFNIVKHSISNDKNPAGWYNEEEIMDSYSEDRTLVFTLKNNLMESTNIHSALVFHDLMNKVSYNSDGLAVLEEGVKTDFLINNKLYLSNNIILNSSNQSHEELGLFLLKCISALKSVMCPSCRFKILNTNLYPLAFLALFTQAISIRAFKNNFNYVLYALTATQRFNNIPKCIGSLKNIDDAKKFFPKYDFINFC